MRHMAAPLIDEGPVCLREEARNRDRYMYLWASTTHLSDIDKLVRYPAAIMGYSRQNDRRANLEITRANGQQHIFR